MAFFKGAVYLYLIMVGCMFLFAGCTLWLEQQGKSVLITTERFDHGQKVQKEQEKEQKEKI